LEDHVLRFRNAKRRRQTPLPAWATESTEEAAIVQREAEAVFAESRSRQWADVSTGLLRTVKAGLEGSNAAATEPQQASWIVVSGERVTVGDTVMVDLEALAQGIIEDVDPEHRLPLVRISTGPCAGQLLRLTPGQIMKSARVSNQLDAPRDR
jgi:hypothetical protein